jgi:hypothetical protein
MIITAYYTLDTRPGRWLRPGCLSLLCLSIALAARFVKKIRLMTTPEGSAILEPLLRDLPVTISVSDWDDLPVEVWSAAKLHTYRIACEDRDSWLHIDNDVLCWLRPKFEYCQRIIVTSKPRLLAERLVFSAMPHDALRNLIMRPDHATLVLQGTQLQIGCGVFGCEGNAEFLIDPLDEVLSLIKANKDNLQGKSPTQLSMFFEQWMLAAHLTPFQLPRFALKSSNELCITCDPSVPYNHLGGSAKDDLYNLACVDRELDKLIPGHSSRCTAVEAELLRNVSIEAL